MKPAEGEFDLEEEKAWHDSKSAKTLAYDELHKALDHGEADALAKNRFLRLASIKIMRLRAVLLPS